MRWLDFMKWWEFVLITMWPSSLGIAALLGWLRGHKAGVEYAHDCVRSMPQPVRIDPKLTTREVIESAKRPVRSWSPWIN